MNLIDSFFLCLDIGTSSVHGIAHHVRSAKISRSAECAIENYDTVAALRSVISELEHELGAHFDSAYITGNFGTSHYVMSPHKTTWGTEHRISAADVRAQISAIKRPDNMFPIHIIPLKYATPTCPTLKDAIGYPDTQLLSMFAAISYPTENLDKIMEYLRHVHIQPIAFYDPHFVQSAQPRKNKESAVYVDMGAEFTTVSVWTPLGPMMYEKIPIGGTHITNQISKHFGISFIDAERVKRAAAKMTPTDMDRFTPADRCFEFSCADVNDIILPIMVEIMAAVKRALGTSIEKRQPKYIYLTGGGAEIPDIANFMENFLMLPVIKQNAMTTMRALSEFVWGSMENKRNTYLARRAILHNQIKKISGLFKRKKRKPKKRFIPILPSTLCFDMDKPSTYSLFNSGGISMIHVDIMDGLYVPNIRGDINQLQHIREQTRDHLHVHLMVQTPTVWARDAIAAGADTIILSTGTPGLRAALTDIRAAHRRCGVALNPESSPMLLKTILGEIDEVMVMAVAPGAAGQDFNPDILKKIKALDYTRKKHNLKYKISVDGGITPDTAKLCWAAGADCLVSGSYLGKSADFPLAVQSLLPVK